MLTLANYFGQFNDHGPSVMEYSQHEYEQHLADTGWSAQETDYLFDLLRLYDLRFIIVADRYSYTGAAGEQPPVIRSVEVRRSYKCIPDCAGHQGPLLHSLPATPEDANRYRPRLPTAAAASTLI